MEASEGSAHYSDRLSEHLEQSFNHMAFIGDTQDLSFAEEAASLAESLFTGSRNDPSYYEEEDEEAIPDTLLLNVYCARARAPKDADDADAAEASWQPVRDWLSSHSAEQVREAAQQRGESGLTALHFAARHDPPLDVIDVLLSIAADTVQWPDSFGWLPIHYACASGSDTEVIKALAEAYPESKTTVDRRGRTPLHFALGDKPASPNVIFLLACTGAASYPDEIGMLVSAFCKNRTSCCRRTAFLYE